MRSFSKERVAQLRAERKLSYAQVARGVGRILGRPISRCSPCQWERGKAVPRIETLIALSDFYDVPLDRFFVIYAGHLCISGPQKFNGAARDFSFGPASKTALVEWCCSSDPVVARAWSRPDPSLCLWPAADIPPQLAPWPLWAWASWSVAGTLSRQGLGLRGSPAHPRISGRRPLPVYFTPAKNSLKKNFPGPRGRRLYVDAALPSRESSALVFLKCAVV